MKKLSKYYFGNLFTPETNALLEVIVPLLTPQIPHYVSKFYKELMEDEASAYYLDNQLVEQRLTTEMSKWLVQTLEPKEEIQMPDSLRFQQRIGEVHARIDVPMTLVTSAMTILKDEMFRTLVTAPTLDTEQKVSAVSLINKILDAALSLINESYLRGRVQSERSNVEYRGASSAHELALEIERVKTSLYNWMTRKIISVMKNERRQSDSVYTNDFGLWIKHKLPLICSNPVRYADILKALEKADKLRAVLADRSVEHTQEEMKEFTETLHEVIWLLTDEADSNIEKASRQDTVTHLLERRFLNTIMQQETQIAMQSNSTYSVIMVDVDHFKKINDRYGHQVGDQVLSRVGKTLKAEIRLTDYAFRYGGEEILVLAPELDLEAAIQLAERLRIALETQKIELGNNQSLHVTASFGVASFKGHPDFLHLINEADAKMYEAKGAGRNCVRF